MESIEYHPESDVICKKMYNEDWLIYAEMRNLEEVCIKKYKKMLRLIKVRGILIRHSGNE